jgi:oligopeptidase B
MPRKAPAGAPLQPPVAARIPHTIRVGDVGSLSDDLFWLRDDKRCSKAVLAHLRAENAYTAAQTRHLGALAKELERELKSRMLETDVGLPTRDRGWFYYTRTKKGQSFPIHCRVAASSAAETGLDVLGRLRGAGRARFAGEEVLLDENELAAWAEEQGGEEEDVTRAGRSEGSLVFLDAATRCILVGVGLLVQFLLHLTKFIARRKPQVA